MGEKNTKELNDVLGKTHIKEFEKYCEDNKDSMNVTDDSFSVYVKNLLREKGLTQQTVFLKADIPERYGYKLLSGEKHTRQRDIILRICYSANFTLDETQKALRLYGMPELYVEFPRDALIMVIFKDRPGDIIDVNSLLRKNGMKPLRSSGSID